MPGGRGCWACFRSGPISVKGCRGSQRSAPLFPGPQGEPAHGLHPRFVVAEIWVDTLRRLRGKRGDDGQGARGAWRQWRALTWRSAPGVAGLRRSSPAVIPGRRGWGGAVCWTGGGVQGRRGVVALGSAAPTAG